MYWFLYDLILVRWFEVLGMVDLSVEFAGLSFRNPVLPAPGPPVKDGKSCLDVLEGGAGGVIAKTISVAPARVLKPHMSVLDRVHYKSSGMANVELWSEVSFQQWVDKELPMIKENSDSPIIASIGYSAEELEYLGPIIEDVGIDGIEFSTHYLGEGYDPIIESAKSLKESVDVPIFPKISPGVPDPAELAIELEPYVDGITAINSLGPTLKIDSDELRPVLGGNGYGWLSGGPIKNLALRIVYEISKEVDIPVIGVGGIKSGEDAAEFILAGADAVGICTAGITHGPEVYGEVADELEDYMEDKGFQSIEDFKGLIAEKDYEENYEADPVKVIREDCTSCMRCEEECPYDAIHLKGEDNKAVVDYPERCNQCGLCVSVCPVKCIEIPGF